MSMKPQGNWYKFNGAEQIDTPALLLYPERIEHNIERVKQLTGGAEMLRPHVKTNKSAHVCRMMIAAGIHKFKCATIAEAEMLGTCGADDVLLAYQPNAVRLERLIRLIAKYPQTRYSCLVDNEATAKMISDAAVTNNITIPVCIDINVGMNRTGIRSEKALPLFQYLTRLPGIEFKGLHAYDGHIEDEKLDDRIATVEREFAPLEDLRKQITALGYAFPLLIAGGSPTCAIHAKRANTECSPGTFVFWDKNYTDHIPEQDFDYAALILTRVVSLPDENTICVDMGYKAISCEKPLASRAYFLDYPELKPIGHSEEHLTLEAPAGHNLKVGDVLFVLPVHVCPAVAMYNQAHVIEQGEYTQNWPIEARGREITI